MKVEVRFPKETGKYRRKNEPTNSSCSICHRPIWVRVGIFTMYDGMILTDEYGNPESVLKAALGAICIPCSEGKKEEASPVCPDCEEGLCKC